MAEAKTQNQHLVTATMTLMFTHKEGDTDPITRAEIEAGLSEITRQLSMGATAGIVKPASVKVVWKLMGEMED